jgi:hypothetical protein
MMATRRDDVRRINTLLASQK